MGRPSTLDLELLHGPEIRPQTGQARSASGLPQRVETTRARDVGEVQRVRLEIGGAATLSGFLGKSFTESMVIEVTWGGGEDIGVSVLAESCEKLTAEPMASPSFAGVRYELSWSRGQLDESQDVDFSGPGIDLQLGGGKRLGKLLKRLGIKLEPASELTLPVGIVGSGGRIKKLGAELRICVKTPAPKLDGEKLPRSPGNIGFGDPCGRVTIIDRESWRNSSPRERNPGEPSDPATRRETPSELPKGGTRSEPEMPRQPELRPLTNP